MASRVHEIKTSTAEQSNGLDQIAQAVHHIDEITQRNAQMVESAFNSSSQLSGRAERLSAAVSNFKLRQGSADEAFALVRKAVEMYRRAGPAALGQITDAIPVPGGIAHAFNGSHQQAEAFVALGVRLGFGGIGDASGSQFSHLPDRSCDKRPKPVLHLRPRQSLAQPI